MISSRKLNLFDTIDEVQHDIDFEPHSECQPTSAAPGSLEKIRVMCERLQRGEELHHEDDECVLAPIEKQQELADVVQTFAREARDFARARRELTGKFDKRNKRVS